MEVVETCSRDEDSKILKINEHGGVDCLDRITYAIRLIAEDEIDMEKYIRKALMLGFDVHTTDSAFLTVSTCKEKLLSSRDSIILFSTTEISGVDSSKVVDLRDFIIDLMKNK